MIRPIRDKAEVALELPDKLYIGTFERSSRFDAHLDQTGVSLTLHRTGDADVRKSVHMHFHYGLFADILDDLATTVASMPPDDANHREGGASEENGRMQGCQLRLHNSEYASGAIKNNTESWMLDKLTARLRKFFRKTSERHDLHAPFRVTTHRGHSVQTF